MPSFWFGKNPSKETFGVHGKATVKFFANDEDELNSPQTKVIFIADVAKPI